MDAFMHRVMYDRAPKIHKAGTEYVDGPVMRRLFEDDYLYKKDGELYPVPKYTLSESEAYAVLQKFHNMGGTFTISASPTRHTARFQYQTLGMWMSSNTYRSKLNLAVARACIAIMIVVKNAGGEDMSWVEVGEGQ